MAQNTFAKTFKSVHVGTLVADRGVIGGYWKPFTPVLSGGIYASISQTFKYRVEGRTLFVKGGLLAGFGTSSGRYTFTFPTGCEVDTAPASSVLLGPAVVSGNGTGCVGYVTRATSSTFAVVYQSAAGTLTDWGNSSSADLKISSANFVEMYCDFSVELTSTSPAVADVNY